MFPSLAKKIHELTNEPDNRKSLDIAIETANELISLLDPRASNLKAGEDALDENIPVNKFPNYKAESWFAQHPYFTGERVALNFYESDVAQIKFYWLGDTATKARVSAGVMLTPNWEDGDLTRNDQYKVGIDFFLSANTKSLLMVVSNNGNLRILEFNDHLSNTQHDILKNLRGVLALDTKDQIHKTLWDALALNEVNKKFYAGIAEKFNELLNHLVADGKDAEDAKLFASRLLGRLLFIWFLRRKNIIQEQYGYFEVDSSDSTEYYDQKLKKLFFKTLNTPSADRQHADDKTPYLNGGLFEAHDNDWANQKVSFPTGFFNRLYEHLEQYNFTTDESSPEYEQVAIDPEMLGRVFESLLATQVTETGDQARKAKGAFYTPREIVAYMCKESLRQHLYTKLDNESLNEGIDKLIDTTDSEWEIQHSNAKRNLWGDKDRIAVPAQVLRALDDIKILDPACGSGAFPMGMLQLMLKMYERLDNRFDIYKTKLRIVQENIYGVDIEPMAVEISRLRAWLSLVVDDEDDNRVEPLPNLDFKFVCANSLLPLEQQTGLFADASLHEKLAEVRTKFFNARVPSSKDKWKSEYYRLTGNGQHSLLGDQRENQLKSFDPFKNSHPAEFFDTDYMFGLVDGFDLVIGNPPYIDSEAMTKQMPAAREKYRTIYSDVAKGNWDLYIVFYGLALKSLRQTGVGCFIAPNQWLTLQYGKALRTELADKLIQFADMRLYADFSAGVNTFVSLFTNHEREDNAQVSYRLFSDDGSYTANVASIKKVKELDNFGVLTSSHYDIIEKMHQMSNIGKDIYHAGTSFIVNDYYVLVDLIEDIEQPGNEFYKLVNTGLLTFDVEKTNWGVKTLKHINKYQFPVVSKRRFADTFPRKVSSQNTPKIIVSESSGIKVFIDQDGSYLADKVTIPIIPNSPEFLRGIALLLNSKLMRWYYGQVYSAGGMMGVTVSGSALEQLPVPSPNEIRSVAQRPDSDTIDQQIYELYSLNSEEIAIIESTS